MKDLLKLGIKNRERTGGIRVNKMKKDPRFYFFSDKSFFLVERIKQYVAVHYYLPVKP